MLAGCYYQSNSVYSQLVMVDSLLRNEQVDSALKRLHLVNLKDCDDESFFIIVCFCPKPFIKITKL